jgi:hypothetical protein
MAKIMGHGTMTLVPSVNSKWEHRLEQRELNIIFISLALGGT